MAIKKRGLAQVRLFNTSRGRKSNVLASVAEYGFHGLFSLLWAWRRFYWVRTAAALGEV